MALTTEQKKWIDKYNILIEWSNDDNVYVVSVEELPHCMTHGRTREEALAMAKEAIKGHVEALNKEGAFVPEPIALNTYSGDFLVRANPDLHKRLVQYSKKVGRPMNEVSVDIIEAGLDKKTYSSDSAPKSKKKKPSVPDKVMSRATVFVAVKKIKKNNN